MAPFTPSLSNRIAQSLRDNPYYFQSPAPVKPSQQTEKGLKFGLRNLDQALGSAQGIPAMPAFGGQTITPGFDTRNLFAGSSSASSPASDRAYESEKNRVAQQTAQDPLFQKYQVAELTKQYNTTTDPVLKQKIGLQIWAQTNAGLAGKLKAGQMGYTEARTAPGMSNAGGSPLGGLPMPTNHFNATNAISTPMTMDYQQTFGTPIPGVGMVSTTPQVFNPGAVQQPLSDSMIQASYGQQLFSSPDFAKILKDKAFLQQAYRQQGLK